MSKRSPSRNFKTSPETIHLTVMPDIRFPLLLRYVEHVSDLRGVEVCRTQVASIHAAGLEAMVRFVSSPRLDFSRVSIVRDSNQKLDLTKAIR